MIQKDFWRNSTIGVIGGGSFGTVLANIASQNCREVRVWLRDEESVRLINATRTNVKSLPEVQLNEKVHAFSAMERIFEGGVQVVIWALPSKACRTQAKTLAHLLSGEELLIHATKGVEPGSLRRVSEVLAEELPIRRIGVLSGPNLAKEIANGEPAATVIASRYAEVCEAGQILFASDRFRVYPETDVVGVEWAGVLKNILAIAAGALDAMKLGWNTRAMLLTRGVAEMVRFATVMGAKESTFLGLAGIGDLMATCSSPLSRNYTVGFRVGQGETLSAVLEDLGSVAEGVSTAQSVWDFASRHRISMPITEGVYKLLKGEVSVQEVLHELMTRKAPSS